MSTTSEPSRLRQLEDIRPLYILPKDDLVSGALVPAFKAASSVDCMMGFFSSGALAAVAPGLAAFINSRTGVLRLIISPFLQDRDQAALEAGSASADAIVESVLGSVLVTEEELERHTLQCLAHLIRIGRVEFQIALMRSGLFHPKVWLFRDRSDTLAIHGSGNMTAAGIKVNFEQLNASLSWVDANQRYVAESLQFQFERLWDRREEECIVLPLPEAVKNRLLESYPSGHAPTEEDFERLYRKASPDRSATPSAPCVTAVPKFELPSDLRFGAKPYEHQPKAVEAWFRAECRGILEMATGSGKTITAFVAARRLHDGASPLAIVMSAPYLPILHQWRLEAVRFGLRPIDIGELSGPAGRAEALSKVRRTLRMDPSVPAAIVVSHTTLCDPNFQSLLAALPAKKLLIADEVHNLGREAFAARPPLFFELRLGLSATPVRQYDEEGTKFLKEYFGDTVFRFPLKDAIGTCLVEYDYFVHPVTLRPDEMDSWSELTEKIRQNSWRASKDDSDEYLAKLFRDRRLVLETAASKLDALKTLIEREDRAEIRHTLIYASDKAPGQLEAVNAILRDANILFHQLTSAETSNPELARRLLRSFQEGELAVLTAKRVLDEGVDVPQICKAFILASTTVERQWIQRRGRVLRRCPQIGKTHAVIHDFVALPPPSHGVPDTDARTVVESELKRVLEFASLSRNAGRPDGAIPVIREMMKTVWGE